MKTKAKEIPINKMILDTHLLSREIIEVAIADFRAKGELNLVSPEHAKVAGLTVSESPVIGEDRALDR